MAVTTHVLQIEGIAQAVARLTNLKGAKLNQRVARVMSDALRKSVVPPMKQAAPKSKRGQSGRYPHAAGTLKKSIGVRALRKRSGEIVALKVGPRTTKGDIKTRAWYAGFVVRGTKDHIIRASGLHGGSASIRAANRSGALALAFNGMTVASVHVKGAHPNDFVATGRRGIPEVKRILLAELTRQ